MIIETLAKVEKYELIKSGLELSIQQEIENIRVAAEALQKAHSESQISEIQATLVNMQRVSDKLQRVLLIYDEASKGIAASKRGLPTIVAPPQHKEEKQAVSNPHFHNMRKLTQSWNIIDYYGKGTSKANKTPVYQELVIEVFRQVNYNGNVKASDVVAKLNKKGELKSSSLTNYTNAAIRYAVERNFLIKESRGIYTKGGEWDRGCREFNYIVPTGSQYDLTQELIRQRRGK